MSDLTLLGLPQSSFVRIAMMTCENKGVPYTLEPVDFRDPAYRAIHPFGKMPALQHGDVTLFETLAIATYIDDAFSGPALRPDSLVERAQMMQWLSAANDGIYDALVRKCVNERFVKPMRGLDPDEDIIAAARPEIESTLNALDAALNRKTYFCGDQLTLADIFVTPTLVYFAATPEGKSLLPDRPNLSQWMKTMEASPGFAKVNKLGP